MAKKAAKKKPKKIAGSRVDVTIVLTDGQLPNPIDAQANKNVAAGGPADRVRWDNQSGRGRTIRFDFDWWPFDEPPTLIAVKKNQKSTWFNISTITPSSGYNYAVSPPLVPGTGPDEPKVTAGD